MPRCGYRHPKDHEYRAVLPADEFASETDDRGKTRFHGRCKKCDLLERRRRYYAKKRQMEVTEAVRPPEEETDWEKQVLAEEADQVDEVTGKLIGPAAARRLRRRRVLNFDDDDAIPFRDLSIKEQEMRKRAVRQHNIRFQAKRNR